MNEFGRELKVFAPAMAWQAVMTVGTGSAGNMGLKALITGGIDSCDVCPAIDVGRRFISEI